MSTCRIILGRIIYASRRDDGFRTATPTRSRSHFFRIATNTLTVTSINIIRIRVRYTRHPSYNIHHCPGLFSWRLKDLIYYEWDLYFFFFLPVQREPPLSAQNTKNTIFFTYSSRLRYCYVFWRLDVGPFDSIVYICFWFQTYSILSRLRYISYINL